MVKLRFPQNLRFFLFVHCLSGCTQPSLAYTVGCVTAAWWYCSAAGAAQSRPVLQSGHLPPATTSDQHQAAGEPSTLSYSLKTLSLVVSTPPEIEMHVKVFKFQVWSLLTYNVKARDPVGSKNHSVPVVCVVVVESFADKRPNFRCSNSWTSVSKDPVQH